MMVNEVAEADPPPDPPSWSDRVVTIAAAVASGIGILGFVTLAGGAVMWERFNQMGVPPDQAVALVPRTVLVVTGAHFLLPAAAGAALIALGLVFLNEVKPAVWESKRVRRVVFLLLAASGIVFAFLDFFNHPAPIAILSGIAIVGAAVVVLALSKALKDSGRGAAYIALIAFAVVGSFLVARAFEHTKYYPRVIPMAYSRSAPGGRVRVERGYLIAETSDRIWFASLPRSSANELREFPRSETDDVEMGVLTDMNVAAKRAAIFVHNLCGRLRSQGTVAAGACGQHVTP
jgi:hypothetical protein